MRQTFDKVLVTGGAGFIGSHTVDALLHSGSRVFVLDNFSSGSLSNLRQWKKNTHLRIRRGSIMNYKTVFDATRKVEAIVHVAALVSPDISVRRPELTNAVNVSGTLNVLRAALSNGIKRVVFASSSSLYGNPRNVPTRENEPLEPITPYGVSKLAGEHYCRVYHKTYDLSTISLRYFNVYGPRQAYNPYSGVITIFANLLSKGLRPRVHGDGTQTRDFIYVSDVVEANLLALRAKKGEGQAFNVGTGVPTTITRLARTLAEIARKKWIPPIYDSARLGDVKQSCAHMAKARSVLGFLPEVTLRQGLELVVGNLRFGNQAK
jgi:UDP-glucose 4-epimerase